jgi:hypothetical protein
VVINPTAYGFSAEYLADHPSSFSGFDEYLREEFTRQHPGWEASFGTASRYNPTQNRYDHLYLLTGNVPEAESHADAEKKVHQLLEEIEHGLKSIGPAIERAVPKRMVKVWKW